MLQKHYVPYSVERINITLENLQKYGIDYFDVDTIDLLIAEAQIAQLHCDFFLQLKKPLQILGALIVPVVAYVAQKIGDAATQNTMIMMAINVIIISIIIFSLLYAIIPIIKNLFYRDYDRNLLGGLYRENPVKSRNYEAVKSSKKWENVGNSYIIPALLLYRYSYI